MKQSSGAEVRVEQAAGPDIVGFVREFRKVLARLCNARPMRTEDLVLDSEPPPEGVECMHNLADPEVPLTQREVVFRLITRDDHELMLRMPIERVFGKDGQRFIDEKIVEVAAYLAHARAVRRRKLHPIIRLSDGIAAPPMPRKVNPITAAVRLPGRKLN